MSRVSRRRQKQVMEEQRVEKEEEEVAKEDEEEVVNCSCGRNEEDGLMIQCDICLCWQHGMCLDIHKEEEVRKNPLYLSHYILDSHFGKA